jgi:hypothetical protein
MIVVRNLPAILLLHFSCSPSARREPAKEPNCGASHNTGAGQKE